MKRVSAMRNGLVNYSTILFNGPGNMSKGNFIFIPGGSKFFVEAVRSMNSNKMLFRKFDCFYTLENFMLNYNSKAKGAYNKQSSVLRELLDNNCIAYDRAPKTITQLRGYNTVYTKFNVFDTIMPTNVVAKGNVGKAWEYMLSSNDINSIGNIYFCTNGLTDYDINNLGTTNDYKSEHPLISFVYWVKYYPEQVERVLKDKTIYISGPKGTIKHTFGISESQAMVMTLFAFLRTSLKKIHLENASIDSNTVIMASMLDAMPDDKVRNVIESENDNDGDEIIVDPDKELSDFIENARKGGADSYNIRSKYIKSPNVVNYIKQSRKKFSKVNENVLKEYEEIDVSIPKTTFDVDTVTDINENSFVNFTKTYDESLKDKDLYEIGAQFAKAEIPLYLVDMKKIDVSDRYNKIDKYVYTFKNGMGKQQTVSVEVPRTYNGTRIMLNGSEKTIDGQLTYYPIIKIEDEVWITANFNKMFVFYAGGNNLTPRLSRTSKGLKKAVEDPKLADMITLGDYSSLWEGRNPTAVMREMSKNVGIITNLNKDKIVEKSALGIFKDNMTKDGNFFITFNPSLIEPVDTNTFTIGAIDSEEITINNMTDKIFIGETEVGNIEDLFEAISKFTGLPFYEYIDNITLIGKIKGTYCKVFGKNVPMIYILMYREGLLTFLDRYLIKYRVVMKEEGKKSKPRFDKFREVRMDFSDAYLIIDTEERADLLTLLSPLLGINAYTDSVPFSGINNLGYLSMILEEFGSSRRFPLDIRNMYDVFIDVITKDVLNRLDLPTDFSDVLMYANVLLGSSESHNMNDLSIYRYRTSEQIAGITNKILSDAYIDYANKTRNNSKNAKMSVSPKAVVIATMELPNTSEYSKINPVNQVDKASTCSYKGHMGKNLARAYTLDARKYHNSHVGKISVVSAYSAPIGIAKHMSIDPSIRDARGFFNDKELHELTYKEIASASEGVTPLATNHDDPARLCMNMSQKNHIIGVDGAEPAYVSTGFDKILPHLATDFIYRAKGKGTVTEKSNYQITITYDNGEIDIIPLDELNRNPSKGSFMKNDMYSKLSVGSKVKEDSVIAYNPQMFKEVPGTGLVGCTGVVTNVGFMALPETYEDTVMISESLSNRLSKLSIKRVAVKFDKNTTNIESFINILEDDGKLVLADDVIIDYRKQTDDDIIDKFLSSGASSELNQEKKKAKVTGELRDIRIHYNGDISEADPSIQKMIKKVNTIYNKRRGSNFNKSSLDTQLNIDKTPYEVKENTKINGEKIMKDQILIEFFIEYLYKAGTGDKTTVYTALKGIICKVLPDDQMPYGVETGRKVHYAMSHLSPLARKTFSVMDAGIIGRTMEWLKEEVSK